MFQSNFDEKLREKVGHLKGLIEWLVNKQKPATLFPGNVWKVSLVAAFAISPNAIKPLKRSTL
jgi:hypothetical protein